MDSSFVSMWFVMSEKAAKRGSGSAAHWSFVIS
jgi:hypothetical protein